MKYGTYSQALDALKGNDNYRRLCNQNWQGATGTVDGAQYINFNSNDYLGISTDADFKKEFLEKHASASLASSGSRLLTGNHPAYGAFEDFLAKAYRREAALTFNSGYHANVGIMSSLAGKGDLIIADKLAHASIIDGMKLSEADFLRFRHNDCGHLERILKEKRHLYKNVLIATESVFSMEGDRADIASLVALKEKYDAILFLDEAHGVGVFGENGLGLAHLGGFCSKVDIISCPMGKAVASQGAFIICENIIRDYLVNCSRPMIFSTALPPLNIAWSHFVMENMRRFSGKRAHLENLWMRLRENLRDSPFQTAGDTQIVPVITGENTLTLSAAEYLRSLGLWVSPIRYPTVPAAQARLRISLTADLSIEQIDALAQGIMMLPARGKQDIR